MIPCEHDGPDPAGMKGFQGRRGFTPDLVSENHPSEEMVPGHPDDGAIGFRGGWEFAALETLESQNKFSAPHDVTFAVNVPADSLSSNRFQGGDFPGFRSPRGGGPAYGS